jgi:hypothetical protein
MSNTPDSRSFPGAWILVVGGCFVFAVLMAAFVFQRNERSDHNREAQEYLAVAELIESAEADGIAASTLLQEYVATGDESLLPEMQALTDSGVQKLTTAISQAGEDPGGFVQTGAELVQAGGQIIALRQTGDTQGAIGAMTELSTEFSAFVVAQDEFIAANRAEAAASQDSADSAETLGTIFLVAAIAVGGAVVAGASLAIRRRLGKREVGMASG